jgi:hypothetical protein
VCKEDYEKVMKLHADMNLGYELNLDGTDLLIKCGLFEEEKPVAVVLGRLTTEAYLLIDRKWKEPQDRFEALKNLTQIAATEARTYGITDTHVWIPPKANCFVRRLKRMGFIDAPWHCMTARI